FGFGTTSPDTSAVLDVASTTRGMLIPRMTTTQRNAISGATKSLLIYNNTIDSFQYYNAGWHTIGAGGGSSGQDTLFVLTPLKANATNDTLY
ncbi:hypothetical protein LMP63_13865, partial [Staphylococcus aureus]|uniref:hypothetical protein n=1 Tax=Staphylococcus aureus TaxID=1280 RepID=UPI001E48C041